MKIGFVGDIHEDRERLDMALQAMEKLGVDEICCLGDIVGFDVLHYRYISTRNASYCLDWVRKNCRWAVAGNHDLFAIRKLPEVNGYFNFPADWYQLDFARRKELGRDQVWLFEQQELSPLLRDCDRDYLESLPFFQIIEIEGTRLFISHALFPDFSGTLAWRPKNPWDFQKHFQEMNARGCRIGISGHLHPNGIGIAQAQRYDCYRFKTYKIFSDLVQYICPCTASSSSKNGFLVFDSVGMTIEAVIIKSGRFRSSSFY